MSRFFRKFLSPSIRDEDIFFAVLLTFLSFSPVLYSGFYGDDALQSLTMGALAESGRTVWGQYLYHLKFFASSRLSLIQLYHWVFVFIHNLTFYKIYILTLVLCNIGIFSFFVKRVTGSRIYFFLGIILSSFFVQFRTYGDPVLTFHGVAQINGMTFLLSLLFLDFYLSAQKISRLILSLFFLFLSMNTYEFVYPLIVIHLALICFRRPKKPFKFYFRLWSPYLAVGVSLVVLNLIVRGVSSRTAVNADYVAAYTPSFLTKAYFLTWARQAIAAVPMSYFLFDPHHHFRPYSLFEFNRLLPLFVILCLGYGFLVLRATACARLDTALKNRSSSVRLLFFSGICLWLIPAAVIALSPHYQSQIVWGSGYTPVYIGSFGVLLIFLAGFERVRTRISSWMCVLLGVVAGGISVIHFSNNSKVVEAGNVFWHYPRQVVENAIRNQVFSAVPQDSFLFIQNDFPWDMTTFFRDRAHLRLSQETYVGAVGHYFKSPFNGVRWVELGEQVGREILAVKGHPALAHGYRTHYFDTLAFDFSQRADHRPYYLDYYADRLDNGYAVLAPIQNLLTSNAYMSGASAREAKIYVQGPSLAGAQRNWLVHGLWLDGHSLEPRGSFTLNENEMEVISQGQGWKLFQIRSEQNLLLDLKSLTVSSIAKRWQPSLFWAPKKETELILGEHPHTLFHVGFNSPFQGAGITLPQVQLGKKFTIELLLQPEQEVKQVPFAHILGNHPGRNNFEGFALQQENQNQNVYTFSFGNGDEWVSGGQFKLNPSFQNYIAIVGDEEGVTLYQNKTFSKKKVIGLKNSSLPLQIANFQSLDRPFKGKIDEVRILDEALTSTEIFKNVDKVLLRKKYE